MEFKDKTRIKLKSTFNLCRTSYNLLWRHSPHVSWTANILQLLEFLKSLSENAILTTADVTSLYTNIMHDDNIESVLHYTKLHVDTLLPGSLSPHKIGILFETILKNNNVLFMHRHGCHSHGNQSSFTICQPFLELPQRNHPGNLYLDNHPSGRDS